MTTGEVSTGELIGRGPLFAEIARELRWNIREHRTVLLPYHPIKFKERWRQRRTWIRWGICLAFPTGSI